jgi:hypothetical protein
MEYLLTIAAIIVVVVVLVVVIRGFLRTRRR